jgi:hypothetical protein
LHGNDKGRADAEFAKVVSKVRQGLPTWEHKEPRTSSYNFRNHKFREGIRGKTIVVNYLGKPGSKGLRYFLSIDIHKRG